MDGKKPYKLYLAQGSNVPQGGIVGDFKKSGDEDFVCEIILNDLEVKKSGCLDCVTTMFPDKAVIYISEGMLAALQQQGQVEEFELWHELGHIHCGHFDDEAAGGSEQGFDSEEQQADGFAADMLGKDKVSEALGEMLRVRAQVDASLKINGSPASVKAIRKLRARINAIKNQ